MNKNIQQLIDFKKVDALLEGFNKSTGFVTAILDLEGNVLSKSGWRQICTQFHRVCTETSANCTISDTVLANQMLEGSKYHFYKCLNGLIDVAVPIVIDGNHIANLFSGQFLFEEADVEFFKKQAHRVGFNENSYLQALSKVPIVSEEKVKIVMDFLLDMTLLISDLALQKVQQEDLNKQILESAQEFKSVFESANVGKSITALTGEINFNKAFCAMVGYTPEELQHLKWQDITPAEDIPDIEAKMYPLLRGEIESARFEKQYCCKNGSRIWADVSVMVRRDDKGNALNFITTAIDITERKKTELELVESEKRYRHILETAPVGIAIHQHGEIVYVNEAGLQLIGAESINLIVGKKLSSIYHPDYIDELQIRMQRLLNGEQGLYPVEVKYIRLDGQIIDVEIMASLHNYNNQPAVQIIINDITEKKRFREELKRFNSELEMKVEQRTALLEATNRELEAFSYSVSHDLRAPLRHINGYVDLLNSRYKELLPEKGIHYLNTISMASKQMGNLIDDLLNYSRTGRQEVRKKELDMNLLVKETIDQLRTSGNKRDIAWDIQPLPRVNGDPVLLKQVWVNLLDNALKYTRKQKKAEITIHYWVEAKNFVFCVGDNGVGFDMKYAHKLFGVFQRLHSQAEFEGTGIGLANVQHIIHKHMGGVWAESEPDKGSRFFFSLPTHIP